jgi:hypothetical protein
MHNPAMKKKGMMSKKKGLVKKIPCFRSYSISWWFWAAAGEAPWIPAFGCYGPPIVELGLWFFWKEVELCFERARERDYEIIIFLKIRCFQLYCRLCNHLMWQFLIECCKRWHLQTVRM